MKRRAHTLEAVEQIVYHNPRRFLAQSPRFNQMAAIYRNFDFDGPLDFVKKAADLSDRVRPDSKRPQGDGAVNKWFADRTQLKAAE